MANLTISIADLQLLMDATARCLTEDVDNYRVRIGLAFFKKAANDCTGPSSPFADVRNALFQKYGKLSEDGSSYLLPDDPAVRKKLIDGLNEAMSEKVTVPFPDLTIDIIEKAKLPLNASEMAILISVGALKEE